MPLLPLFRLLAVCVAFAIACGSGLPGLVRAVSGTSAHVCTCVAGGSHAACPVCNRSLADHGRSPDPRIDGAPCGDGRIAIGAACDPGVLPVPLVGAAPACELVPAPRADSFPQRQPFLEPATPPPRFGSA